MIVSNSGRRYPTLVLALSIRRHFGPEKRWLTVREVEREMGTPLNAGDLCADGFHLRNRYVLVPSF
jgi:hypothetical protein